MSEPSLTVAIPCHNGARHLGALLTSLLAQTRQDFELLLVDDGSTDDSIAVAEATAGPRLKVVRGPRRGLAANFVHAASLVRTEHFVLAHQDDAYERDFLATLVASLQRDRDAAFAHCCARAIDDDGNPLAAAAERFKRGLAARAVGASRASLYELLWRGNFVCCPSVVFRTEHYRASGGFDPRHAFALDWELWFRMLRGGWSFVTVLEPLVRYRRHRANATTAANRTLARFEDELQVLAEARSAGVAAGLLPADTPPSRSLRNNLVNEAFEDLRAGDRAAFAAKLAFVARVPELARDPFVAGLRVASKLGPFGVALAGVARGLAVRVGLGA